MNDTVIYFIRHSEATPKANFKDISNHENEQIANEKMILTVSGEKRAEALSLLPEFQNIDAVYSSSYVRALQTAKYIALENNTIINVDDRLNERKVGNMGKLEWKDFHRLQTKDFDFKLPSGESINQTKKRMVEAIKNILMFEAGNRVAVVSHATALTALLSTWCEQGLNYDDEIILTYDEQTIVDATWSAPMAFKVVFDGMNVKSVERLNIDEIEKSNT